MIERLLVVNVVTFRRLLRSRVLWVALIGAILVLAMSLSSVSLMFRARAEGQQFMAEQMLQGAMVMAIKTLGFFSVLIALVIGVTVERRDVGDGTAVSMLSKPLSRGEYIAGIFGGGVAYLTLVWGIFAAVVIPCALALHGWSGGLLLTMGSRLLVAWLALSIALCCSIRLNAWLAGVATVAVLQASGVVDATAQLLAALGVHVPDAIIRIAKFPFPNTDLLDSTVHGMIQGTLGGVSGLLGLVHVLDYTAVMVVCAFLLFRGLELNQGTE
jgi:ABC-type transport system involved in multi-copper enzyme maturation permease subunit